MPIGKVLPFENNPRINKAAVSAVAKSIAEFGFRQPIVVDEKCVVIIGHTRLKAAQELGLKTVPVHADNKLHELAEWDLDKLSIELKAIVESDIDLTAMGFDQIELNGLLANSDVLSEDADDTPDTEETVFSKPGEIYCLGPHRLMCGDSTSPSDWAKLMREERASICFTSPPYANKRAYTKSISDWDALMHGVFTALPLAVDAQLFVNLGMFHCDNEYVPYWDGWLVRMKAQGWRRFGWYVWDQGPGMMGDWAGRLAPAHEFIFHFNRQTRKPAKTKECKLAGEKTGGSTRNFDGSFKIPTRGNGDEIQSHKVPDSVIRITRHKGSVPGGDHPAVFPAALPLEFFSAYGSPSMIAVEPFCGSGTSIVAGSKSGLLVRAMEIAPQYCDVTRRRWTRFARGLGQDPGPGALD